MPVAIQDAFGLLQQLVEAGCGTVSTAEQMAKKFTIRTAPGFRKSLVANQVIDADVQQFGYLARQLLRIRWRSGGNRHYARRAAMNCSVWSEC